ncbi:hypothetical protein [Pararhizobium haloflavum]|uniref:hypothetical protein n=1 Tax=Pararhizobium haloflavum TaxID=2037914 RepID=UPI000C17E4C5|nr:hypothetical protein [Pararhizobium haloflavum]
MANACMAFRNLADGAFLRASSAAPFLPVQLLTDRHVGRKWRSTGNAAALFIDLGEATAVDTVALIGCSMDATGSMRVRASNSNSEVTSGVVVDETFDGLCDPEYGYQLGLLGDATAARYWRIDLDQPGADYIEAGRLYIGDRYQFGINFQYGWEIRWIDRSRKTKSRGGQTFIDRDNQHRMFNLGFGFLRPDERYGFVEELDRINGAHEDVLFIGDPAADHLGKVSVWGLIEEVSPVSQPFFRHFAKPYTIEERL